MPVLLRKAVLQLTVDDQLILWKVQQVKPGGAAVVLFPILCAAFLIVIGSRLLALEARYRPLRTCCEHSTCGGCLNVSGFALWHIQTLSKGLYVAQSCCEIF